MYGYKRENRMLPIGRKMYDYIFKIYNFKKFMILKKPVQEMQIWIRKIFNFLNISSIRFEICINPSKI